MKIRTGHLQSSLRLLLDRRDRMDLSFPIHQLSTMNHQPFWTWDFGLRTQQGFPERSSSILNVPSFQSSTIPSFQFRPIQTYSNQKIKVFGPGGKETVKFPARGPSSTDQSIHQSSIRYPMQRCNCVTYRPPYRQNWRCVGPPEFVILDFVINPALPQRFYALQLP